LDGIKWFKIKIQAIGIDEMIKIEIDVVLLKKNRICSYFNSVGSVWRMSVLTEDDQAMLSQVWLDYYDGKFDMVDGKVDRSGKSAVNYYTECLVKMRDPNNKTWWATRWDVKKHSEKYSNWFKQMVKEADKLDAIEFEQKTKEISIFHIPFMPILMGVPINSNVYSLWFMARGKKPINASRKTNSASRKEQAVIIVFPGILRNERERTDEDGLLEFLRRGIAA
jgi:hypothetical protein